MKIVNEHGYIHLAREVEDSPLPLYFKASRRRKEIIKIAKQYAERPAESRDVPDAKVFQ